MLLAAQSQAQQNRRAQNAKEAGNPSPSTDSEGSPGTLLVQIAGKDQEKLSWVTDIKASLGTREMKRGENRDIQKNVLCEERHSRSDLSAHMGILVSCC